MRVSSDTGADVVSVVPMALDLDRDLVGLLQQITDIPSVSGSEEELASEVESTLRTFPHLDVVRYGNAVIARTELGRDERVAIAGHIDTVPIANNLPSWVETVDGEERVYGRGTCDQKGGIAVQLAVAAALSAPNRDVTWIFYDNEEVDHHINGLGVLARAHPELFDASFAVLTEPSGAVVEGGCQGTLRARITTRGLAAHSARPWMGSNAIHLMADVLDRLKAYESHQPEVEGLRYREALSAVRIGGGIAGNVIPDACWIEVNFRYAPDRTQDEAELFVRDYFMGQEIELLDNAVGARPGLDKAVAADFVAAVGGEARPKFGWTDVARFSSMGIPAVNFGPGEPIKAHADDEFCPSAQLQTCYDGIVRWLSHPLS